MEPGSSEQPLVLRKVRAGPRAERTVRRVTDDNKQTGRIAYPRTIDADGIVDCMGPQAV